MRLLLFLALALQRIKMLSCNDCCRGTSDVCFLPEHIHAALNHLVLMVLVLGGYALACVLLWSFEYSTYVSM